ncbi:hypothetical protein [Trinickia sp. EG282A]|uniref:hypothetical protein n=1 Tax=Trinickia sp. EG282A TaxID=3237013 RepID=UPI0034D34D86
MNDALARAPNPALRAAAGTALVRGEARPPSPPISHAALAPPVIASATITAISAAFRGFTQAFMS